jgi:hypothetical protein
VTWPWVRAHLREGSRDGGVVGGRTREAERDGSAGAALFDVESSLIEAEELPPEDATPEYTPPDVTP